MPESKPDRIKVETVENGYIITASYLLPKEEGEYQRSRDVQYVAYNGADVSRMTTIRKKNKALTLIERAHLLRASKPPEPPRIQREFDRQEIEPAADLRCLIPGYEDDRTI